MLAINLWNGVELSCSGWALWSIFGKSPHGTLVVFGLCIFSWFRGIITMVQLIFFGMVLSSWCIFNFSGKSCTQVLDCARKRIHNQQLRYMYIDIYLAYIKISLIKLAVRPLQTTNKCSYLPFTSKHFSQLVQQCWFFQQLYMGNDFHCNFLEKSLQLRE